MKRFGRIAVCFASGLVFSAGLCASGGAVSNNPYEPIVTRNVFGLNPPQKHAVTKPQPPAKITPDGIMTIFGTPQVLFNVAVPPHPPTPATEKSYILSVGQRQDGIEVTHIDEKNSMVTFNNHGVVQQIPLVKAPPITTPTPVVMHRGSHPAAVAFRGFRGPHGGNMAHFGNRSGSNPGNTGGGQSANNPGGNYGNGGGPMVGGSAGGQNQQLSPEQQMVLIAAQKAQAKEKGNPIWKIFPPTPYDKEAGTVNTTPTQAPGAPSAPTPPSP